jgi:hypothetical protein
VKGYGKQRKAPHHLQSIKIRIFSFLQGLQGAKASLFLDARTHADDSGAPGDKCLGKGCQRISNHIAFLAKQLANMDG